jgi:hypothetical protein
MDFNQNFYISSTSSLMTKPTAREAILETKLITQERCYHLSIKCSKLRLNHPNTAVGLQYDDFTDQIMVCAHLPSLPPHFPCPTPSFLSQSHITENSADALQKLTWFHGQFTPFPDTIPPGAVTILPPHDPTAPGTSAEGTTAGHRRSNASNPRNRKRPRATTSTSTVLAPAPRPTLDASCHSNSSGSDPDDNRVERIVQHFWNGEFKQQGAGTTLYYTIKWVGQANPSLQLYDHAAICRLNPSYWLAYARWGDGKTPFALTFSKDRRSQKLARYNSYFTKCWREHM